MTPFIYTLDGETMRPFHATDTVSCAVTRNREGDYYLEMVYPANGAWAEKLTVGNYVGALVDRVHTTVQRFIITEVVQDISGLITLTAYHETSRLAYYPVRPFPKTECTPAQAVQKLLDNALRAPNGEYLFLAAEDSTMTREFGFDNPVTLREAVYGPDGLLEIYGGEIEAASGTLRWYPADGIGESRGVISYGVNLLSYTRTFDISDRYSHAYVWWSDGETTVDSSKLLQLGNESAFTAATIMDLSQEFEDDVVPTEDELKSKAKELAGQRQLTKPIVTMEIEYIPLRDLPEYSSLSWLEEIGLFDEISVDVPMYGITRAKVTGYEFDAISERYISVTVGNQSRTIGRTLATLL